MCIRGRCLAVLTTSSGSFLAVAWSWRWGRCSSSGILARRVCAEEKRRSSAEGRREGARRTRTREFWRAKPHRGACARSCRGAGAGRRSRGDCGRERGRERRIGTAKPSWQTALALASRVDFATEALARRTPLRKRTRGGVTPRMRVARGSACASTARPTKESGSKWASALWAPAKASQLREARSETAPTVFLIWKLWILRWMPASSASWRCARTMAVRAAIEPVVPVPTKCPVSARGARQCQRGVGRRFALARRGARKMRMRLRGCENASCTAAKRDGA